MLDEIEAIIPSDKLAALFEEKMANSPAFKNLIIVMRGEEFKKIVNELKENKLFQELIERAKEQGVDIDLIREILQKIFGWAMMGQPRQTRSLSEDLNDFMNLIPINDIVNVAVDYLANDAEVQEAVEFVTGPEFGKLVLEVEKEQDYIDVSNFYTSNE